MKTWWITLGFFCCGVIAMAQGYPGAMQYSISHKKAIKVYEATGEVAMQKGWDAALKNLDKAISIEPNFAEAYLRKAEIYQELGDVDQALSAVEKAIEVGGVNFHGEYFRVGQLYMRKANYEKAKLAFKTYLSLPRLNPSRQLKAILYQESCDFAMDAMAHPVEFEPINLGENINSRLDEYFPTLTVDDQTMIYTRQFEDQSSPGAINEDFFIAHKDDAGNWAASKPLGMPFNTPMREGAPTISADGQMMVFTVCDNGGDHFYGLGRRGFGSCDLFWTFLDGDKWVSPVNVGKNVNSTHFESQPCLSADGRQLYFIRGKRGNTEDFNIMVSELTNEGWSFAQYVKGDVNSKYSESSVLIHPDGQTLYFASNGHPGMGGYDLFKSKLRPDGSWGKPENLGYPINTQGDENSIMVNASGSVAFFASDREGGLGGLDLYQFELPADAKPVAVTYMKGKVFDKITKRPLEARFELTNTETEQLVVESYSNRMDGGFVVSLPTNHNYALNASLKGYMFYSETFQMSEKPFDGTTYHIDVPMTPIAEADTSALVLKNVFFETAKFDLKPTSRAELNKLVEFLQLNPSLRIRLEGHTDNVGDDAANQLLSENRAKSVVDYLVSKGVASERLEFKGFGESQPVDDNTTEEGRARNRRTQFRILSF